MRYLRKPLVGAVLRRDAGPLHPSIPHSLVGASKVRSSGAEAKIIDLGQGESMIDTSGLKQGSDRSQAFFHSDPPRELHTPWCMRAPELVFDRPLSRSVDMWSVGCLVSTA